MRNHTVFCALLTLIILAMCHAESKSARLTAFGKTPNQSSNNQPKKNTLGRTRECKEEMDCGAMQNTTCMNDPRDDKMRCLCRDSSSPINGACPNLPRAVKATCSTDNQCIERAECKVPPNSTTTSKICLCKEGFYEDDGWCNTAYRLELSCLAVFLTATLILL